LTENAVRVCPEIIPFPVPTHTSPFTLNKTVLFPRLYLDRQIIIVNKFCPDHRKQNTGNSSSDINLPKVHLGWARMKRLHFLRILL
jgi:hypothetical protein